MNFNIYTVEDTAKILRCSKASVYSLVKDGLLSPVSKIGRKIIIPELAIKSYLYQIPIADLI